MPKMDTITLPTHHTYYWSDGSSATNRMSAAERHWSGGQIDRQQRYSRPRLPDVQPNLVHLTPVIELKTEPGDDDTTSEASTQQALSEVCDHFKEILAEDETALQAVDDVFAQCNEGRTHKLEANNRTSAASMAVSREEASRPYYPRAQHDDPRRSETEQHHPQVTADQQQSTSPAENSQRKKRRLYQTSHSMDLRKRRRTAASQKETVSHTTKGGCNTLKILRLESVSCEGGTLRFIANVELSLEDIQGIQNRHEARELVIRGVGRETWDLLSSSS